MSLFRLAIESYPPTIAMEGALDVLRNIFKSPKKQEKLSRDEFTYFTKTIDELVEKAEQSVGNPKWVEEHYQAQDVVLGPRDHRTLCVNGKPIKLAQAMKTAKTEFERLYNKKNWDAEFKTFFEEQKKALKEIEAFYESLPKSEDKLEKVKKFAEEQIKKIKVPVVEPYDWEVHQTEFKAWEKHKDAKLPRMSAAEAVAFSKEIVPVLKHIHKLEGEAWAQMHGSDFEQDFWDDKDDYVGERLRTGDVGYFFYHQSLPEQVREGLTMRLYDMQCVLIAGIAWLLAQCGGESGFSE